MVRNESGAKNREGTGLNVGLGDSQLARVNSIVDLAGERLQPLGHFSDKVKSRAYDASSEP